VAGALTVSGLDVQEANLFGTADGLALDVFRAADPFGRIDDDGGRVERTIEQALADGRDLAARVDERRRAYSDARSSPGPVRVEVDADASETDTVVEVYADDDVGLLYRLASALADLALDVRVAKVATQGERVVDVFYVRDPTGHKVDDEQVVERLRAALSVSISG
jgi:[protein-PII] uridylyltransferase